MKCTSCGATKFRQEPHEQRYVVDGIVFRVKMWAAVCRKCGAESVAASDLGAGELVVAVWLARHAVISGASFRFMRKALMLRANALAELLGVASESISRWENAKRGVDRSAWTLLASVVLDRAEGENTTEERLRAFAKARPEGGDIRLQVPTG